MSTTSVVEATKTGCGRVQCGGRGCGRQTSRTSTAYNRPSFIGCEPTLKHDIFDYQEAQQAQKYQDNIEALKVYVGRKHMKYTADLVSSLDTLTLNIPVELAVLTETTPTPGALKNGNWTTRKERNNGKYTKISWPASMHWSGVNALWYYVINYDHTHPLLPLNNNKMDWTY